MSSGRVTQGVQWGGMKKLPDEFCQNGFCANVVIVMGLKGFKYKHIKREHSVDYNIHIAMNGGAAMTFEEMEEMQQAIKEGKEKLVEITNELKKSNKKK